MEVKGGTGDFPTQTFDANFKVMINMEGGIISGSGANGEAGRARLYCASGTLPESDLDWRIYGAKTGCTASLSAGM
jgi:hypothetical protein